MKSRADFIYFAGEGFHSIFSHGLMSSAAVCMIMACLIIMGSFSLLAINVDKMLGQLEDDNQFLAYIDETYDNQQASALADKVARLENIASVTFVTKEVAKAAYVERYGNEGLYADMPDEVLRDRLVVHVEDLTLFSQTVERVQGMKGVANIRAERDLADGFVAVRNVVTVLATVLVVTLAGVSLFIIANTIRLATFTRRDEIAIMKMCGATNSFVRWPFIFEGLILGVIGAIAAFFIQLGLYSVIYRAVAVSRADLIFDLVPFGSIWGRVMGGFLLAGVVIGSGGSVLAIRRFLRT